MNAERCRQEIARLEAYPLDHPEFWGILMGLADWYIELSLIEGES